MNKLSPHEVAIIQMALSGMIEDLEAVSKNPKMNFTPEAWSYQRDMLSNANSALKKIAAASGKEIRLDPYKEGDENEFLTKES